METVATAISWVLIAAGSFFVVVGATGLVRMPDVFTRMHAAGILDTVGAGLMLIGMMFAAGLSLVSVKLLIILAVILFTSPVATHALAQAALHAGVEPILASKRVLGIPESKRTGGGKPPAKDTPAKAEGAPAKAKVDDAGAGEASEPSVAPPSESGTPETGASQAAAPDPDESTDDETNSESREARASRAKRSGRRGKAATSSRRTRRSGRRTGASRGRRRTKPSSS